MAVPNSAFSGTKRKFKLKPSRIAAAETPIIYLSFPEAVSKVP